MIGFANYQDKEELKLLWSECFSDTSEFIDKYFDTMFEPLNVIVVRKDCEIVAMATLHCVQYVNKEKASPCGYLYAVGVKPQHRGQGYFKKLIAFAKKEAKTRGYIGIVTVPATQELVKLYKKMGYKTFSAVSLLKMKSENINDSAEYPLSECDKQEFFSLRQEYLNTHKSYIKLDEKQLEFVYDYIGKANIFTTCVDNVKKYAVCEKVDDSIVVKENNFTHREIAKLGGLAGEHYDASNVSIKVNNMPNCRENFIYAMGISFKFGRLKGYANLMLD